MVLSVPAEMQSHNHGREPVAGWRNTTQVCAGSSKQQGVLIQPELIQPEEWTHA